MRFLSRQNVNLIGVARKATPLSSSSAIDKTVDCNRILQNEMTSFLAKRSYAQFKPVYTLTSSNKSYHNNLIHGTSSRWANTSSGSFAPSKGILAETELGRRGLMSVFDEETDHNLPSLPVPTLQATMEKLKESISPMAMNSAEFVSTLQLIDEFCTSAGPKLEQLLQLKAEQTRNWLTHDWWQRDVYLQCRKPLIINSNPAMIYPQLPFEVNGQQSLLNTVSLLISGIIDFELALVNGYNPESQNVDSEYHLDANICYNQYRHIFGSLRIPNEPADKYHLGDISKTLSTTENNKENTEPLSLILSYRNNFYEIKLANYENENGRIDKLNGILSKIVSHQSNSATTTTTSEDGNHGIGVLTATKRDQWAESVKLLDAESLEAIKNAHFIISLDTIQDESDTNQQNHQIGITDSSPALSHTSNLKQTKPGTPEHKAALSRQILHSDPNNIGNRWFDKPIQLIVATDDKAESLLGLGINYEHSIAEGQVVSRLIEYSYDKVVHKHHEMLNSTDLFSRNIISDSNCEFRQLRMIDHGKEDEIELHLKKARQDYCSQISEFELEFMNYRKYGSNAIKSLRYSPDSWFQVALQLSFYNVHKRLGPCYESASTRRFALGRTETIRSLTKEVAQFCFEPNLETLQAAVKSHKSFANSANNGQAIDRVLMGYRWIFNELRANNWAWGLPNNNNNNNIDNASHSDNNSNHNYTYPGDNNAELLQQQSKQLMSIFNQDDINIISAFFNNELIKRSNRYALSTSQVTSAHPNIAMSYGPLLPDGYGCCYNISGQRIVAAITANSQNQSFSCDTRKLHENLAESLDHMKEIAETGSGSNSSKK